MGSYARATKATQAERIQWAIEDLSDLGRFGEQDLFDAAEEWTIDDEEPDDWVVGEHEDDPARADYRAIVDALFGRFPM